MAGILSGGGIPGQAAKQLAGGMDGQFRDGAGTLTLASAVAEA